MKYSQGDEQDWILSYFREHRGTFLDIGANDGVTLSNTRALAHLGWRGVCVDASPTVHERLSSLYAGSEEVQTICVAVGASNGRLTFHDSGSHLKKGDVALLSTLVDAEREKWESAGEVYTTTEVECVTFPELLSMCRFKTFDFISIDAEGMDLQILEQIQLHDLGTDAVIVEVNERDPKPYIQHCGAHGLRYVRRNAENLFFAR